MEKSDRERHLDHQVHRQSDLLDQWHSTLGRMTDDVATLSNALMVKRLGEQDVKIQELWKRIMDLESVVGARVNAMNDRLDRAASYVATLRGCNGTIDTKKRLDDANQRAGEV